MHKPLNARFHELDTTIFIEPQNNLFLNSEMYVYIFVLVVQILCIITIHFQFVRVYSLLVTCRPSIYIYPLIKVACQINDEKTASESTIRKNDPTNITFSLIFLYFFQRMDIFNYLMLTPLVQLASNYLK